MREDPHLEILLPGRARSAGRGRSAGREEQILGELRVDPGPRCAADHGRADARALVPDERVGRELAELAGPLRSAEDTASRPANNELGERDNDLLRLLAQGRTNQRDRRRARSSTTPACPVLLNALYARIGTTSRAETTAFAFRTGLAEERSQWPSESASTARCASARATASPSRRPSSTGCKGDFAKADVVDVDSVDEEVIREAALACPTLAITLEEVGEVLAWKLRHAPRRGAPRGQDVHVHGHRLVDQPRRAARRRGVDDVACAGTTRRCAACSRRIAGRRSWPPATASSSASTRPTTRWHARSPSSAPSRRIGATTASRPRCASASTSPTRRRLARTSRARASTRRRASRDRRAARRSWPAGDRGRDEVPHVGAAQRRAQGHLQAGRRRVHRVAVGRSVAKMCASWHT